MTRTCAALLVCAAVAAGCGAADEAVKQPPPRPAESVLPADWTRCSNEAEGYAIEYPATWSTAELEPEQACSFFDPEPFELVEGSEFPPTALEAHFVRSGRPFEETVADFTDPTFERVIGRKETTLAGFPAVRLETEATGEGLYDAGTITYAYVIDHDGEAFLVRTTLFPGDDAGRAKAIVDEAVETVRFFAPKELPAQDLPEAVAATRLAIANAADARDYRTLAELIPSSGFEYTYGGPVDGGPTAYWRRIEAESPERPLEALASILDMPYTKVGDTYVWPFAYDRDPSTLTTAERELLSAFASEEQIEQWEEFGHYLGWRAGINEDGIWAFFVAGD